MENQRWQNFLVYLYILFSKRLKEESQFSKVQGDEDEEQGLVHFLLQFFASCKFTASS